MGMNGAAILELHGARRRLTLPSGLRPLLDEMTLEVIRNQPTNIYMFLADFLESKLAARSPGAQNRWRDWSWEGTSILPPEELAAFLADKGLERNEADEMATKIQARFRGWKTRKDLASGKLKPGQDSGASPRSSILPPEELDRYLAQKGLSKDEAHIMATKIQAAYRGWRVRQGLNGPRASAPSASEEEESFPYEPPSLSMSSATPTPTDNSGAPPPDVEAVLEAKGVTKEEADAAATKIQAAFRGFTTRNNLAKERETEEFLKEKGLTREEADKRATKIQAAFRGYRARKEMEAEKKDRLSTVPEGEEYFYGSGESAVGSGASEYDYGEYPSSSEGGELVQTHKSQVWAESEAEEE